MAINFFSSYKESRLTSDNLARLSSISRNNIQYSSIPRSFNYRKSDRLTCSLDGGLDKCETRDNTNGSAGNVSEPLSRDDGQSSDSVDHDYQHPVYVSAEATNNKIDVNNHVKGVEERFSS